MSSSLTAKSEQIGRTRSAVRPASSNLIVRRLTNAHRSEVLSFFETRPLHTVFMRGFIRDNGLESTQNRGFFYGCRNASGQLQGVALIGHATLFETRNEAALEAFGNEARQHLNIHMIMGEQHAVGIFWKSLASTREQPRRTCTELLFEQSLSRSGDLDRITGLRRATLEDIRLVMPVQAQMARAESGVDPIEIDPAGFEDRYARRIQRGRVWVCVEDGTLRFKADILSETPDVIYLEGIYVRPDLRGNGFGLSCLAQVSRSLSQTTKSVCLFVNERAKDTQEFYKRAGFRLCSTYWTFFLKSSS
ncbi:MAG TPA: GNAT family N-acetyltransferase [Pyrinomonadaceae bacterium]|nr:GNAT family N-acetyltransferase [Pyrinomonadaceae bacterium]